MSYRKYFALVIFLSTLTIQGFGQNFLSTQGKAIVNENGDTILIRGMGLGGWMLQEGYMLQTSSFADAQFQIKQHIERLIGPENTQLFYDKWLENYLQEEDIDSMKSWGFNAVRLPMHYNLYTLPIEDEPVQGENTWLDKGFELTDSVISWCSKNEMYVVLDLHAAPGGQGQESSISDYDPSKPSLWQSEENKNKAVALWKKLAERYADEPWVAGYDLLNETNWTLPQNTALRELYEVMIDSIRSVDNKHIIFIEGNSFANDFTGLTPPWAENIVYSPHRYWAFNTQEHIEWALDVRDQNNTPIFIGESGENSNTWFRDAIALWEANEVGWAWWPYKKIESISGPIFVSKSEGYQSLLDYWSNGGQKPSQESALLALLELADNLKLENSRVQIDVIDAMFRQVNSTETLPFITHTLPGVIYATDFDLGQVGHAYYDIDVANYHLSTGNFTAWNQGWTYRNDGVDIQPCEDVLLTNGFNVGWTATGEWMQYDVNILEDGVYDIEFRAATAQDGGTCHFEIDGANLSEIFEIPNTGGWQTWETLVIQDIVLTTGRDKLKLFIDNIGANINYYNFVKKSETTDLTTTFLSANTLDDQTIELHLNKPLLNQFGAGSSGFEVFVEGESVAVNNVTLSTKSNRIIEIGVNAQFVSSDQIRISYSGDEIEAEDLTKLVHFTQKNVENNVIFYHQIPGRIEAEDFYFQSGVQLETTTDEGGGQNIGFLDSGDFLDYYVNISDSGPYKVTYRTAALSETGGVQLQLITDQGEAEVLQSIVFQPTGDWQTWRSTSQHIDLEQGQYKFRLLITKSQFNMNWFEFSPLTSINEGEFMSDLSIYPNPSSGVFNIEGPFDTRDKITIDIYDSGSRTVYSRKLSKDSGLLRSIDLHKQPEGIYFMVIRNHLGQVLTQKLVLLKY